jgi:hypothetical protein
LTDLFGTRKVATRKGVAARRAATVAGTLGLPIRVEQFLPPPFATQSQGDDSAAAAALVERYHRALAAADSVTALGLLAEDATIAESGGIESRQEYRSHHLAARHRIRPGSEGDALAGSVSTCAVTLPGQLRPARLEAGSVGNP